MRELGVDGQNAMLLLRRKVATVAGRYIPSSSAIFLTAQIYSRPVEQDAEMMRLQLLGDPDLMRELQEVFFRHSRLV